MPIFYHMAQSIEIPTHTHFDCQLPSSTISSNRTHEPRNSSTRRRKLGHGRHKSRNSTDRPSNLRAPPITARRVIHSHMHEPIDVMRPIRIAADNIDTEIVGLVKLNDRPDIIRRLRTVKVIFLPDLVIDARRSDDQLDHRVAFLVAAVLPLSAQFEDDGDFGAQASVDVGGLEFEGVAFAGLFVAEFVEVVEDAPRAAGADGAVVDAGAAVLDSGVAAGTGEGVIETVRGDEQVCEGVFAVLDNLRKRIELC